MNGAGEITQLLQQASAGNRQANDALFDTVYKELRRIARSHRRRWIGNDTLNTTALISEAYVRLADSTLSDYADRSHFFATASRAMRQTLINYAERIATAKRGGNAVRITLTGLALGGEDTFLELLHIDRLLNQLEATQPRQCRVFECRVFGGMTVDEISTAVDVSTATVKRDWTLASAWLFSQMSSLSPIDGTDPTP
ncbi:MAG: ECF-type sigma factor [Congregibacter sp.]